MLYFLTKSQLLDIIVQGTNTTDEQPNADTVIIDGTALINAKSPGAAKTFDDYATELIVPSQPSKNSPTHTNLFKK